MDNDIGDSAGGGTCVLAPGLASLSDDELTAGFDRTLSASRQAEWDLLAVEAEIGRRQMYLEDGTVSLREWISIRSGEGDRAAYHQDRIARSLGGYPALSAALADGRVSVAHVGVLLSLARLAGTDDDRLVELGETHTVPQLETIRRAARPVSPAADEDGHRRRHLRWRYDDAGTVRLHGRLHGPEAVTVTNLIAAMAETIDDDPDGPPSFDTRCADALVELCSAQINHSTARRAEIVVHVPLDSLTHPDDETAGDDDRTGEALGCDPPTGNGPTQTQPDDDTGADDNGDDPAIDGSDGDVDQDRGGDAGEDGDATDKSDGDSPSGRPRVDASPTGADPLAGFDLHGPDPYGLDGSRIGGPGAATTWDGTVLSTAALQRLLCDSTLRVTIDDDQGRAIGIGFRSRNLPPWLRNQLRWRDGSCRFPGCQRTRWVDGHHIVHWPHGPTNMDNLVLLCSAHHRLVHEGGWHVAGDPDTQLTFTSPTGHTHTTRPATHPKPRRRPRRRRQDNSPSTPGPTGNSP